MGLDEFVGALFPGSDMDELLADVRVMSWANTFMPEVGSMPNSLGHGCEFHPCPNYVDPIPNELLNVIGDTWMDHVEEQQPSEESQHSSLITMVSDMEEDMEIRLVHALLTCAEAIQRGELQLANSLIGEITDSLLTRVNMTSGIGKVASYFTDALSRRLYQPSLCAGLADPSSVSNDVLYHHFYEACPYLKFAHFTANQAILESFEGQSCVHVIDFNLVHGLQWPALIQALALRPGGPPSLRLTAVSPPSSNGRDYFHETGLRLAQLARSINVTFSFRVVTTPRLEDLKPWMFQTSPKEVIAINSIFQLHQQLGSNINSILDTIRLLNPKIVTIVEQEANHNHPDFLVRFTQALHYYSAMFDSLEACTLEVAKPLAETYMQREICNIVCCEGSSRVERHEPLAKWQARMNHAGFKPLHMGHNALKQANMLLTLCSADGYCVQESDGCLTLGWHNCALIAGKSKSDGSESSDDGLSKKDLALQQALDQINASFGKGAIMWLGRSVTPRNVPVVSTGSFALDIALGIGGLPKGRVVEIFGPEASGKTTLALHVIAEAQKLGGYCAFIDAEHALDPALAEAIGVNTQNLLLSQPDCGEQALSLVDTLIRSGSVDVVVVDSVAALVPKGELDGEMGDAHVAMQARLMSQALRKLSHSLAQSQCILLFLNQVRAKISTFGFGGPTEVTCGGNALKFYASVRLNIRRTALIKKGEETIGSQVLVKVIKNKHAPPFKTAEFELEFGKGISQESELISLGVKHKLINKQGGYYHLNGQTLHGKDAIKNYISENVSSREELALALREKLLHSTGEIAKGETAEPLEEIALPDTTDEDVVTAAEA